jgi:HlyD family secretion protein
MRMNHQNQSISTEDLDQVMTVVRPRTWLALLAVGLLLAAAVGWGFWGVVTTRVSGQGILIRSGALFPVVSVSDGQLLSLEVEKGQFVSAGSVVARVDQPLLRSRLREARQLLDKLNQDRARLERHEEAQDALMLAFIARQRDTLNESIRLGGLLIEDLRDLVQAHEELRAQGIASKLELEKQKAELHKAKIQLLQDQHELSGLDVFEQRVAYEVDQRLSDLMRLIVPVQEEVISLRERLEMFSVVRSLHSGVIIEMHKNPGEMLQAGDSLVYMERASHAPNSASGAASSAAPGAALAEARNEQGQTLGQTLGQTPDLALALDEDVSLGIADEPLVVAYVPPFQGLDLRPGQSVHVVPETVREEEHGVILGEVLSISPYPVTPKGMMRVLDNPELVHHLSREGAPVMVVVRLHKDEATPSGYRWSSGQGPPTRIKTGAQCMIRIIARTHAPIELIIPELKRRFLGIGATAPDGRG